MFGNAIPALLTAGLLQVVPPVYQAVPPVYQQVPPVYQQVPPGYGLPPRQRPVQVLPLPLPLPLQGPLEGPPGCLSRGDARAAVQSGQVVPLSSVLGQIRSRMNGDIVSPPSLCSQGGRLIYFLDVLVGGRVIRLQVDGQTGRVGP